MPLRLPLFVALCATIGIGSAFGQWTDPPPYAPPSTDAGATRASPGTAVDHHDTPENSPPAALPSPSPRPEKADEQSPNATGWRPSSKARVQVKRDRESPPAAPDTRKLSIAPGVVAPSATVEDAARRAFARYLSFWSGTNAVTPDAMQSFYEPTVRFYGRLVGIGEVARQKRDFVERWPVRDYVAILESLDSQCREDGQFCDVEGKFTFRAANPDSGRLSSGVGHLNLRFAFVEGAPRIVEERSTVISRGGIARPQTEDKIGE